MDLLGRPCARSSSTSSSRGGQRLVLVWIALVRLRRGDEPGVGRKRQVARVGERARFPDDLEAVGQAGRQPGARRWWTDDDDAHGQF